MFIVFFSSKTEFRCDDSFEQIKWHSNWNEEYRCSTCQKYKLCKFIFFFSIEFDRTIVLILILKTK